MEELGNSTIAPYIISLLVSAIGILFGLLQKLNSLRHQDRAEQYSKTIEAMKEGQKEKDELVNKRFDYLELQLKESKDDYKKLQEKYYDLGSAILPAMQSTEKTLADISQVLNKITRDGG